MIVRQEELHHEVILSDLNVGDLCLCGDELQSLGPYACKYSETNKSEDSSGQT